MRTRRQFILAPSLARLIQKERGGERVVEGYFPGQQHRSVLVQVDDSTGSLVLLSDSPEGPVEERTDIPSAHAQALLAVTAGQVAYVRTNLSIGPREIQLRHFLRPGLLGLVSVDQEDDQEFQPLPWFGPEVSAEPAYQPLRMALDGLPAAPEVELTDQALNSLLDLLENKSPSWPSPHDARTAEERALDQLAASGLGQPAEPTNDDQDADDLGIEDQVIRELARSLRPHSRS